MRVKVFFYCLFSAILLWLSFPNFNLGFLAWFAFVPLFFALHKQTKRRAFWISYFCGFVFFILTLYWLVHVTLTGLILLCLYLALYFAFFGYFLVGFKRLFAKYNLSIAALLSCLWVILEYLRGEVFTGFPWALLGYSQYLNIKLIQFADITGSLGVSFLVIFVNLCIFETAKSLFDREYKISLKIFLSLLLIFTLIYSYGNYSFKKYSSSAGPVFRLTLLQGNIPQDEKWQSVFRKKIKENYFELTRLAARDNPDLIIWPETSYPDYIIDIDKDPFAEIKGFVRELNQPILFGAVYQENNKYFNSAFLISNDSEDITVYKKIHLVPFGEYLPLRKNFPFLERVVPIEDFSAGRDFVIFNTKNKDGQSLNFGVLICFEDTISALSRQFRLKGADFLVNITNDAWFKQTSSPYQHLQASVFRAIENRVYLVRAANTGISAIIDNYGRVIRRVRDEAKNDIFIRGHLTGDIKRQNILSFYTKFGDVFVLLCGLYIFLFPFYLKKKITQNLS